jgi:hypothetical protein
MAAMESLLHTLLAHQNRSTTNKCILQTHAMIGRTQEMARDAKKMRQHGQRMRGKRDE